MSEINLIIQDFENDYLKENFSRIQTFINQNQTPLKGSFNYFNTELKEVPENSLGVYTYEFSHELSFTPENFIVVKKELKGLSGIDLRADGTDKIKILVETNLGGFVSFLAGRLSDVENAPIIRPDLETKLFASG